MTDAALRVELYGTHVGELTRASRGRALFAWSNDAIARWPLRSTPLSASLPVGTSSVETTESFFGALLPEGRWLDRLANALHVGSNDLVGIFDAVGADLAGALTIGAGRTAGEPRMLGEAELVELLSQAAGYILGGGGSALPGFQRKLTLTHADGGWIAGNGTLASTHILKPVSEADRHLVEGENYVLGIARAMRLLHFDSWVETIGRSPVLVIERYDRRVTATGIERIHQEDLAQALALPWGGDDKFERGNPGASLAAVAAALDRDRSIFDRGEPDREKLLRYTVLNVAAGNTDAHAKNFSLLRFDDGHSRLAPFYDAAPLALGFEAPLDLAMSISGERFITRVTVDHLVDEARTWGVESSRAREVISQTLDAVIEATRRLPAHESISKHVPGYIRGQAQNLAAGRPARIDAPVPPILMPRLGTPSPAAPAPKRSDPEAP